ncbi:short transient receptor potential channel 6-like [Aplysia californica]|uniref:Short transient receptor potential channel 6-like n=1 Tax=Aplysia californica TaxID=6500 RepID=A0ABM1VYU9_APLCA|nr:short transient receptor potential channel 6-like [Aplysia californica]
MANDVRNHTDNSALFLRYTIHPLTPDSHPHIPNREAPTLSISQVKAEIFYAHSVSNFSLPELLVEKLIYLSNPDNIHEAVLQAIDAGSTNIAEVSLRHPRYLETSKRMRRMGDTDGFFKPERGSQFPSYVTPLNLAAQKNQFVIVQLLLQRGEIICKPHKFSCGCQECTNKRKYDQLRSAKWRLNAYRGLASEAYISLCSNDPFLTGFELCAEIQKLADTELIFRREYTDLDTQLKSYLVKLLDRVWTQRELTAVLDKTGHPTEDKFESLARFRLAVEHKQKSFVSHPNCQQRIARYWYEGLGGMDTATWYKRLAFLFSGIFLYPIMVPVFLVMPDSKHPSRMFLSTPVSFLFSSPQQVGKILRLPAVKFISHIISYIVFLILIIISSIESVGLISKTNTLGSNFPKAYQHYTRFRNVTGNDVYGYDFPLRRHEPLVTDYMISLWIMAMIILECQEMWDVGYKIHFDNVYNMADFVLLSVYTATFTLRYYVVYKWNQGLDGLEAGKALEKHPRITEEYAYWLNADRRFWSSTDPENMAEGLFAVANIVSLLRISYLLPANQTLGPLQISLGRMVNDILKFVAIVIIVFSAFMVALRNLFAYYSNRDNIEMNSSRIATPLAVEFYAFMVALRNLFAYYSNRDNIEMNSSRIATPLAVEFYGDERSMFQTVFWSIYGRGKREAVTLGAYNNQLTEVIGELIDAMYHITIVIVLLNILIAMMSRSFEKIAEEADVEWKFARSALYMDYISKGRVLPVPMNMLEIPHELIKVVFRWLLQFKHKTEDFPPDDFDRGRRPAANLPGSRRGGKV